MNAQTKIEPPTLAKLREPFPDHHVSKLPKPTKAQTEAVKADFKKGVRCKICGSWHHPEVVHLDYVGHAALTDRLLDTDPEWSWEPLAYRDGLPAFDGSGGLWIKLTVLGVSRLGYGHAAAKPNADPGAREKEIIGDALRNAAMRFGAALDLWHKGDLHLEDEADAKTDHGGQSQSGAVSPPAVIDDGQWAHLVQLIEASNADKIGFCKNYRIASLKELKVADYPDAIAKLNAKIAKLTPAPEPTKPGFGEVLADEIPY